MAPSLSSRLLANMGSSSVRTLVTTPVVLSNVIVPSTRSLSPAGFGGIKGFTVLQQCEGYGVCIWSSVRVCHIRNGNDAILIQFVVGRLMVGASFFVTDYAGLRFGSSCVRDSLWTSRTCGASITGRAGRAGGTGRTSGASRTFWASLPGGTLASECHSDCDD
jgi:hypothetical protein